MIDFILLVSYLAAFGAGLYLGFKFKSFDDFVTRSKATVRGWLA